MDEELQRFDVWVERYGDTRPKFTAAWCAWLAAKADAKAQAEEERVSQAKERTLDFSARLKGLKL